MYKFNKEKLVFEKTYKLMAHRIVSAGLFLCLGISLMSTIKAEEQKEKLRQTLIEKEKRIKLIKQPLREETYLDDLYKNIGFTLTDKEREVFEKDALKYREQIETAKVPATLVWWIAYNESNFDHKIKNKNSTATGSFQILQGTWDAMCKLEGMPNTGRLNKDKQMRVLLVYLNYLYARHGNWKKSMDEYMGGVAHYPINFLLK